MLSAVPDFHSAINIYSRAYPKPKTQAWLYTLTKATRHLGRVNSTPVDIPSLPGMWRICAGLWQDGIFSGAIEDRQHIPSSPGCMVCSQGRFKKDSGHFYLLTMVLRFSFRKPSAED